MADYDHHQISREVIGALVKQLLAAMVAAVGHFQEAPEHMSFAAVRALAQEAAPHRLRERD
jgi:hypothetical protein